MTSIAILGSGPAGCYTAQFLRKSWPDADLTVFDRLPVPYGLIRYGVAPDHQGTKAVTRQFERLFERQGVRFAGNIEVGRDLALQQLRSAYDAVVLATGLHTDRALSIPGADLPHVYGAGRITRLVNGHPDETREGLALGRSVVIIGMGNVAMDVLRLLVKPLEAFEGSDVDEDVLAHLRGHGAQRVQTIDIVSRSAVAAAKFDAQSLKELRGLPGVKFEVLGAHGPASAADKREAVAGEQDSPEATGRIRALNELVAGSDELGRPVVRFHFGVAPKSVTESVRESVLESAPELVALGSDTDRDQGQAELCVRLEVLDPVEGHNDVVELAATSVVTAIGFEHGPSRVLPAHAWPEDEVRSGRLEPGLYVTGWLRRGPRGTIPENRIDAREVADRISEDLSSGALIPRAAGFEALPHSARAAAVDYSGWKAVDAHELAAAAQGRARRKITDLATLRQIAAGVVVDKRTPHHQEGKS